MYRFCFDYDGSGIINWLIGNMDINAVYDDGVFATSSHSNENLESFIQFIGTTNNTFEGIESCLTDRSVIAVTQ